MPSFSARKRGRRGISHCEATVGSATTLSGQLRIGGAADRERGDTEARENFLRRLKIDTARAGQRGAAAGAIEKPCPEGLF